MLLATLLSLAMLTAQEADPCDLNPSPECTAQRIAANTEKLSLTDVAADARSGAFIYRATFENGDWWPAVSFERRPNQSPELVIYGTERQQIRMPISAALWEEVETGSRYAGRELVSNGIQTDCVVQTMTNVQIGRPGDREGELNLPGFGGPNISSYSQTTCGGGLTSDYALLLAELACGALPECAAMGEARGQTSAQRMPGLFRLRGDRVAAATLSQQRGAAPFYNTDPVRAEEWDDWLEPDYNAILKWGETEVRWTPRYDERSTSSIALFVAQQAVELRHLRIEPSEFGAIDPERGWIEGVVSYSAPQDPRWKSMQAPYRQEWALSGDWRLTSWTIGPFTSAP